MSDADELRETIWMELLSEEQSKRQQAASMDDSDDSEYWNAVANGLSEAAEIVKEVEIDE